MSELGQQEMSKSYLAMLLLENVTVLRGVYNIRGTSVSPVPTWALAWNGS